MNPNWYPDATTFRTTPYETFVVSPTAYAFAIRNYFNDANASEIPAMRNGGMYEVSSDVGIRKHYTWESKIIPGLFYDVTSFTKCIGEKNYTEVFQMSVMGQLFANPKSINEETENTGILKIISDAASS